jgi:hypothetical protein
MFCTPTLFALCGELKAWGVEPTFEVGHVVGRGFADVGSEEFLVLPGPKILSLTAGTVKDLPDEHRDFFFWIPSEDECAKLLDLSGVTDLTVTRAAARKWIVSAHREGGIVEAEERSLRLALIQLLIEVKKLVAKGG